MATARFGDQEFEVGNACPRNPAWARAMSEVLPPAAFLQSEVLRSVAVCPSVRPTLEAAGVEFVEEGRGAGPGRLGASRRPPRAPRLALALGGDPDVDADPWSDEARHGSMGAGIVNAVAPRATIVSVKPAVSATGAISSMRTLAAMDYLAGLATEMGTPIIANRNKPSSCPASEANLVQTVWAAGNNRHVGSITYAGASNVSVLTMNTTGAQPHAASSRGCTQI